MFPKLLAMSEGTATLSIASVEDDILIQPEKENAYHVVSIDSLGCAKISSQTNAATQTPTHPQNTDYVCMLPNIPYFFGGCT